MIALFHNGQPELIDILPKVNERIDEIRTIEPEAELEKKGA